MKVKGALSDLWLLTYQPLSVTKDIDRCLAQLTVACNWHINNNVEMKKLANSQRSNRNIWWRGHRVYPYSIYCNKRTALFFWQNAFASLPTLASPLIVVQLKRCICTPLCFVVRNYPCNNRKIKKTPRWWRVAGWLRWEEVLVLIGYGFTKKQRSEKSLKT